MTDVPTSHEQRILRMVKKVLTDVAKDTHTRPGLKHPLSEHTVQGIRECLTLIVAREQELAQEAGQAMSGRPHFVDEPRPSVVSVASPKKSVKPADPS